MGRPSFNQTGTLSFALSTPRLFAPSLLLLTPCSIASFSFSGILIFIDIFYSRTKCISVGFPSTHEKKTSKAVSVRSATL